MKLAGWNENKESNTKVNMKMTDQSSLNAIKCDWLEKEKQEAKC